MLICTSAPIALRAILMRSARALAVPWAQHDPQMKKNKHGASWSGEHTPVKMSIQRSVCTMYVVRLVFRRNVTGY